MMLMRTVATDNDDDGMVMTVMMRSSVVMLMTMTVSTDNDDDE